jgi:hypothetical protein
VIRGSLTADGPARRMNAGAMLYLIMLRALLLRGRDEAR